jgi:hypothetical protein
MKVTKYLIAAVAVLTVCSARADEGMWLLQLMKQQNSIDMMKKQGLKLAADDLYNPNGVSLKDAVGIFGGGCTGEIISPEGLILTNHHCGYGAIQQHSSVEHDYLTDGFWAKSRNEELPTPGLKFRFVHRIVDITDLVNAKVKAGEVTEVDALTAIVNDWSGYYISRVQAVMDGKKLVFNYPILEKIVERFKQSVLAGQRRQETIINYDIDEYDERLLRHLALGYTKEMITGLKGMPFGVKSIEKRQNDLVSRLFRPEERTGVNACRLVTRAFQLRILDIDNLEPDEE